MGARSSKPLPRKIEPEATAVEVFQQDEAPRESSSITKHKTAAPAQGGTTHIVRTIGDPPPQSSSASDPNSKHTNGGSAQTAKDEKPKKKRRRSKKDKNKPPPPKLVRAQTQLNELKNVKPLLQQSPQARQQHFEQIKDAYALDEEAKKAPPPDARSRFFNFENWRKTPQTPSSDSRTVEPPTALQRSQTTGVPKNLFASARSARGTEEVSNGADELEDNRTVLDDVESLPLPSASRTFAITAPETPTTPNFRVATSQAEYGRPDIPTTPVIRVKTSERRTPERSRSQRSDLRLDDVDEDLMEHILSDPGEH